MFVPAARAEHCLFERSRLERINRKFHGKVVDYTNHHGGDRRIWSQALCKPRSLYVYLPPCYDCTQAYPLMIWLHGLNQDHRDFFDDLAEKFDTAMANGCLPPMIIAIPDGSINQSNGFLHRGSFFLNSDAGRFEDWVMQDVWEFVNAHYLIRPEPDAHILAGESMGGFAAYNLGIKYRPRFKIVVGIYPPLNMRWVDCHGRYRANFDPCCWGWREQLRWHEVLGRFFVIYPVRMKQLIRPLYDRDKDVLAIISRENPIEMIDSYGLKEGELSMFAGYGSHDQFNLDAQVESFVALAKQRGLTIAVDRIQHGRHDSRTAIKILPDLFHWLSPQVAPFSPGAIVSEKQAK